MGNFPNDGGNHKNGTGQCLQRKRTRVWVVNKSTIRRREGEKGATWKAKKIFKKANRAKECSKHERSKKNPSPLQTRKRKTVNAGKQTNGDTCATRSMGSQNGKN